MKISLVMDLHFSLKEIENIAGEFLFHLGNRKVVALQGEMGAGKTTFVSALVRRLGSSEKVSSPTFSIINEYRLPEGSLFHLDLYRLKDEQEAINAGVEDCIYSGKLCIIEWPEKAPGLLPDDVMHCRIEIEGNGIRKLDLNL